MSKFRVATLIDGFLYKKWANYLKQKHGVESKGRYSDISRWNAMLFEEAIRMVESGQIDTTKWG